MHSLFFFLRNEKEDEYTLYSFQPDFYEKITNYRSRVEIHQILVFLF